MGKPRAPIDDKIRQQVSICAGFGLTWAQIAGIVGIAESTLRRRCQAEYNKGTSQIIVNVAKTLYQTAMDRADKGHVAAAIFFLKTRGRWRERDNDNSAITPDMVKAIISGFSSQLGNTQ